jgi:MoaA/NifB/PqqE/SkfB family radical SAM enzyme
MRDMRQGAAQAMLKGAIRTIPVIPDQTFLSLFDRKVRGITYPEGREFVTKLLLMIKKALSSSSTRRAATKALDTVMTLAFDAGEKRAAFANKYGFKPPRVVVISPTMRCNLHCFGCYAGNYDKADDLPWDVFDRVINECKEMGIYFLTISGGEPFISDDVLQIFEKHNDVIFQVYTNGTLIDSAMAKRLSQLGNVVPCISVEGFEEETDLRRGKGTFARIIAAMQYLREAGVLFGFSATATRENNELISSERFVDYYVDKGCFIGWYFNYIPIGRKPHTELMPTPEQRIERWRRICELRRSKDILLSDFWCDGSLVGGCIAGGRSYLHINNKGDAEPCVFAHFAADNVKEKSLAQILDSTFLRCIRSRQPYSPNLLRPCMIIDNPTVLREAVAEGHAHPTHAGAETIITDLASQLDEYARQYAELADPVWLRHYVEPVNDRRA